MANQSRAYAGLALIALHVGCVLKPLPQRHVAALGGSALGLRRGVGLHRGPTLGLHIRGQGLGRGLLDRLDVLDVRVGLEALLAHGLDERVDSARDGGDQAGDDAACALGVLRSHLVEHRLPEVGLLEPVAHQVAGQLLDVGALSVLLLELRHRAFAHLALDDGLQSGVGLRVVTLEQVGELVAEHGQGGDL